MADANLKVVIKSVGDLMALITSIEKGLSFDEVGELISTIKDGINLIGALPATLVEYKSLSDADRADLEAYVASEVILPENASVQGFIQEALDGIISLSKLFQYFPPAPVTK